MKFMLAQQQVRRLRGGLLCAGALWGGVLSLSVEAQVQAQSQTDPTRFDLPAAPLVETLRMITQITGVRIEFDSRALAGLVGHSVQGSLTLRQAVERAVDSLPLAVSTRDDGSLRVAAVQSDQSVLVVARRDQAETSFRADRSDTATRSGSNLMDVPSALTIITSKVLETQQATSVRDALANVSGVAFQQSTEGPPTFTIRGFGETTALVNGVSDSAASLTNVFNVERVEVLKGPQAILSGSDSLGGSVNIVTKKPQADPIRTLTVQYGSHADATMALDLSGAVSDDRQWSYRLITSDAEAQKSDTGFEGRKDASIEPQLRWKDKDTDLIAGISHGRQHAPVPSYTLARRDGVILPVPVVRPGSMTDGFDTQQERISYQFERAFSSNIKFISRLDRSVQETQLHLRSPFDLGYDDGAPDSDPNGAVGFSPNRMNTYEQSTSGDHYLRINGETGAILHKISIGFNHALTRQHELQWSGDGNYFQMYRPDAGTVFPDIAADAPTLSSIYNDRAFQVGLYAQELMTWNDWNFLFNIRRTHYNDHVKSQVPGDTTSIFDQKSKLASTTPGIGAVYAASQNISIYANYSEGFVPVAARNCANGLVPPRMTHNREVGSKFDILDGQLLVTMAGFQLAESNALQYDQLNNCYNVLAGQVTRGFELDVQGQLSRGWSVLLNYTFNTRKYASDPNVKFQGVPKNKVSVWTTYETADENWYGLGFGAGLSASTSYSGSDDPAIPLQMPAQAQLDISIFRNRGPINIIFGIKNVTDRTLYGSTVTSTFVPLLPRRTLALTVKRDFN